MKNTNNTIKTAIAILAILLVSSIVMITNVSRNTATAQSNYFDDYGDLLQYEWIHAGGDEGLASYSAGPAPAVGNVLWSSGNRGGGVPIGVGGYIYTASGNTLRKIDPWDGTVYYSVSASGTTSAQSNNGLHVLDDTFLVVTGSGVTTRFIENGTAASTVRTPNAARHPGSGTYFSGHFSKEMKMYFNHAYNTTLHEAWIVAHDCSDPYNLTIAWRTPVMSSTELLCSGGGLVYGGSTEGMIFAWDINGTLVWESHTLGGIAQQAAWYMEGKLYISSVTWQIMCFNATTGEQLWSTDKGIRAFSAYRGCGGMGMVFDATVELDPHGHIQAFDAETGERRWKQPAYFSIRYATMACGGGKVVTIYCDQAEGVRTGGTIMPGRGTACYDAYTGTLLWRLPDVSMTYPTIIYGNVYGFMGTTLYCIGGEPRDWSHGLIGDPTQNARVAVGQWGPSDISTPRWEFQTHGDTFSSPAVVDGKVYFGSADKNIYCLDAYTGELIWNYTTGHYVRASVAVVDGRVHTGGDDGYFYALDAITGEQLWNASAGGFFPYLLATNEADPRSSPLVIGGRVYVGSLDGNLYCLNAEKGNTIWTADCGRGIMGSPAYSSTHDSIYIASLDGYLYAIYTNGSLNWRSAFTLDMQVGIPSYCENYNTGTPSVVGNNVYIGGGVQYGSNVTGVDYAAMNMSTPLGANGGGIRMFAFNAQTGASVWNVSRTGNTQPGYVPTVQGNYIYAGEFFEVTKMSTTDPKSGTHPPADYDMTARMLGNRTAGAWLGYQIQSSVAYADRAGTNNSVIYVGSDIGSIYALNPADMSTLSVFTAGGNVPCSPAIWNGMMFIGATNGKMYCFSDAPIVTTSLFADGDRGAEMWNNETLLVCGTLLSHPIIETFAGQLDEDGNYAGGEWIKSASEFSPPLPNQTISLIINTPDGEEIVTTTTDREGNFAFEYSPTEVGSYGWTAYYEGYNIPGLAYAEAYGEWNEFAVTEAPSGEAPLEPTDGGFPVEYVYVAVAAIVIVLVAVGAYIFLKRGK